MLYRRIVKRKYAFKSKRYARLRTLLASVLVICFLVIALSVLAQIDLRGASRYIPQMIPYAPREGIIAFA